MESKLNLHCGKIKCVVQEDEVLCTPCHSCSKNDIPLHGFYYKENILYSHTEWQKVKFTLEVKVIVICNPQIAQLYDIYLKKEKKIHYTFLKLILLGIILNEHTMERIEFIRIVAEITWEK